MAFPLGKKCASEAKNFKLAHFLKLPLAPYSPSAFSRRPSSQITIDDILQHFLAAAAFFWLAVLMDVCR